MPPVDHACQIKKKDMTTELYSLWGGKRKGGDWEEKLERRDSWEWEFENL